MAGDAEAMRVGGSTPGGGAHEKVAAAGPARDQATETRLARHLQGLKLGWSVHVYRCVNSTMEAAHELARDGAAEGTLVVAERQEQGRGRLGRAWESPEGGAYLSLVLRPKRPLAEIPQLALIAGLAAAEAVRDAACLYPSIRWPNDLLLNGRKVAGILVEARNGAVVVGIGLNVSTDPAHLPAEATSLAAAGSSSCSREDVVVGLCRRLAAWYDVWTAQGFGPVREALRPWMGHFGQPVHLTIGSQRFEGTASDVDESGRLLVRLDSGIIRAFEMGEVTLLR